MNDLREALTEAYDEDPATEAVEVVEEAPPEAPETVSEAVGEEPAAESEAPPEAVADAPEADGSAGVEETVELPQAPLGWEAELWGGVPEGARDHITAREAEVERVLRNSSEARKSHQVIGNMHQTYGALMASEGWQHPLEAFDNVMQTVSQLKMGSPEQRAQTMANLINHFGVDISSLDNALVGEAPPEEVQQQSQMQQMIDQRMAPVNQMMGNLANLQQQKMVESNQQVSQEVEQFGAQAEFMNVVRGDMADLMDMATQRGQQMTLQDAYDKACQINPQVQQALQQRMAQKQAAASSVAGRGQGGTGEKKPQSLHDQLVAAWDDLS